MKKTEISSTILWIVISINVLLLTCLIIYNCCRILYLLQSINQIQPHNDLVNRIEEGFTIFNSADGELKKMNNDTIYGSNITKLDISSKLPIKEYCIKSSYNSACSGTYIGVDVLKYVLSRGCRYLDLEIYLVDNTPYVGFSMNPSNTHQNITSATTITLNDALTAINVFGFSSPSSNSTDPLFINIRPQSCGSDPLVSGMYKYIAGDITNTLSPKLINKKITGDTTINEIMNKIVIVMDINAAPEYIKEPLLEKLVNIESGGNTLHTETYFRMGRYTLSPPVIDTNGVSNVVFFREVHPNAVDNTNARSNPDYRKLTGDYGVQIITNRFYINDSCLNDYEEFFNNFESAFVPFSKAVGFVKDS